MDEQLSKKLSDCGVKKSRIETLLKMPKNSLAGMMNGTRPTPEKWHDKLWQYIHTLEGKIIPYPDAPIIEQLNNTNPLPTITIEPTASKEVVEFCEQHNLISSYCKSIGLTPEQLIADHQKLSVGKTPVDIIKKDEYDATKDWRWKKKMGLT